MVVDYGSQLNKLSIGDVADNRDNQKVTTSSPYERLERRISYVSQGLYMKHLLKHLTTPNLTISEIFARLYSSFTQGDIDQMFFVKNEIILIVSSYKYMSIVVPNELFYNSRGRLKCFRFSAT